MRIRQLASVGAIVFGALLVIGGLGTWLMVSNTLGEQQIVVAEDAEWFAGEEVRGPLTAYAQAGVIDRHALDMTGGLTYAELDREDPLRETAMNASFLQASLFTSVLAFGVSAMAMGMGVLFVLIGLGIRDVKQVVEFTAVEQPEMPERV
jgi:hypothetical protein